MSKKLTAMLYNWKSLNKGFQTLTEDELEKLLAMEKAGQARLTFLQRIQGRINKLQARRKQLELLK